MKRISNRVGKGGSTEANKRIQGNGGSKETKVVPRAAADFVWQLNIYGNIHSSILGSCKFVSHQSPKRSIPGQITRFRLNMGIKRPLKVHTIITSKNKILGSAFSKFLTLP